MESLLKQDLEKARNNTRENRHHHNLKISWSTVDTEFAVIESVSHNLRSVRWLEYSASKVFNNPTAMYFEQGAQYGYEEVKSYSCITRQFIASIYEIWRVHWGEDLNIEFGHFLANPVRIMKRGPQTIPEILAVHKEMEQPRSGRLPVYDNSLNVHTTPQSFDRIVNKLPETWSTAVMARAKQDGYDFISYPKTERRECPDDIEKAVMKIKAKATGEPCHYDLELDEWDRRWKPGYD
jgi:hypothetical protein